MSEEEVKTIITRMLSKLSSTEKRLLFAIDEEKNKEIKNLHSIIKEAREKIEYYKTLQYGKYDSDEIISSFEGILDKVEEN